MALDLSLFGTVFVVIFVAELPDKTALASLVLATRFRATPVFLGAALALTIQSVVAVAAGGLLSLLPARPVHVGAGVLFLVSALVMWRRKGEDADSSKPEEPTTPPCTYKKKVGPPRAAAPVLEVPDPERTRPVVESVA